MIRKRIILSIITCVRKEDDTTLRVIVKKE